jgi:hypothetical protein
MFFKRNMKLFSFIRIFTIKNHGEKDSERDPKLLVQCPKTRILLMILELEIVHKFPCEI